MSTPNGLASKLINVAFIESTPVLRPLTGSFLRDEAREFSRLVEYLRTKHTNILVLDLGGCKTISSDGLGSIAACWDWCQMKKDAFMSVVLPKDKKSEVVNLFDITGLSRMIGSALQRSVRDALSYLKRFALRG